jgi:hypothetical protein
MAGAVAVTASRPIRPAAGWAQSRRLVESVEVGAGFVLRDLPEVAVRPAAFAAVASRDRPAALGRRQSGLNKYPDVAGRWR